MKKILLVLLMLVTTGMVAKAQIALGVKAGLSSSKVDIENSPQTNLSQFTDEGNITGYHAGAFLRFKTGGFLLQPEAVFSSTGGKLERKDVNTTEEIKARFNRLDVPIMVGYSFLNFFRVQAGPVASVLVNGKFEDEEIDDYLNKSDWGWQAGVGLDLFSFTVDLRYERINREFTNPSNSFDIKNKQVILSLGYKLFGK